MGVKTPLFAGITGIVLVVLIQIGLPQFASAQEADGRIDGRLVGADGKGISGATVMLKPADATTFTGPDGQFSFSHLRPDPYTLTIVLGENPPLTREIVVSSGTTAAIGETVDWQRGFADSLVVRGVSRQAERLIDAPSPDTLIVNPEIELKAPAGQLAKLLEFTPGAQLTQGGLWDFNVGTRGFNRSLSRRVAVLLDGRDLSLPFFGYQGWAAFSFPLDDLASIEFVRGPSAALYGANAVGGVISLTSKEPRFSRGGMLRVALGEEDTVNLDARWAGQLGHGWYARAVGGIRQSNGFAVSRVSAPEYSTFCAPGAFGDCLPREVVPFDGEDSTILLGGLRVDHVFDDGLLLTAEGGYAQGSFGVFQAAGQRAKSVSTDGKRPWTRVGLRSSWFDVAASYDGYYEPSGFQGLSTGSVFKTHARRLEVEGQTSRSFRHGLIRIVVGGDVSDETMTSLDPALGTQTFLSRPVDLKRQAVFGQGTWDISPRLRAMLALRGDWSSLQDFQLSPKGSIVYTIATGQSIRFSYSRAFQTPNSLEYFLAAAVSPPADLSAFNGFCMPFGVDCKFGPTPVLAVGNENLHVETVQTFETGYRGVIGKAFLTLDYYRSHSSNLVTGLLPQLGTALGRLNPSFGPWNGPVGLPSTIVDQIRTLAPLLSTDVSGANVLVAASYTNFAKVDSQGIDAGLSYELGGGWRSTASYSWFHFSLPDDAREAEGLLLPNTPSHTVTAGLGYDRRRIGASLEARWVDRFRWADGFFVGNVESFVSMDATASYPVSRRASVGVSATNLLDSHHWETFGGAIVRRRVLGSLRYDW